MRYDEIHWWQFPLKFISIRLKNDLKKEFFRRAESYFNGSERIAKFLQNKAGKYRRRITTDYRIIWHYKRRAEYIPAWIIFEIAKAIDFDLLIIESNIVSYISSSGRIVIRNPKLPVKVTPEFASIAIHIMCDGSKGGNKFFYFQKRREELERFIKLLKNVFGDYESNNIRGHYVPTIFTTIISEYYEVDSFLSDRCRIPYKILKGDRYCKIASLLSVLHDEGNVGASVRVIMSNKHFLLDIITISESLDYGCNKLHIIKKRFRMKKDAYCFSFKPSGVENLFNESKMLIKEFPLMNIGRKMNYMESYVNFRKRGWKQRRKHETKTIIKNYLRKGPKTAYEIREIANVTLWTTYHHLQHLMSKNEIEKVKDGNRYNYYLINHR